MGIVGGTPGTGRATANFRTKQLLFSNRTHIGAERGRRVVSSIRTIGDALGNSASPFRSIWISCALRFSINDAQRNLKISTGSQGSHNPLQEIQFVPLIWNSSRLQPFRSKRRGGYALDEKVCSFRRTHPRSACVKGRTFNSGSFHSTSNGEDPKSTEISWQRPFSTYFLLLFGRETHASTTQSDPLLLPTRNGPCREDGTLHWEYLF